MNDNRFIGIFHSEDAVVQQIQLLLLEGYDESDIYVVAKNEEDISMVRGRTDVDTETTDAENWFERFIAFISGEEPVKDALEKSGIPEADRDQYYHEIENGGILLYVDNEYGTLLASGSTVIGGADPNLGPDPLDHSSTYEGDADFSQQNQHNPQDKNAALDPEVKAHFENDISMMADMDEDNAVIPDHLQRPENYHPGKNQN